MSPYPPSALINQPPQTHDDYLIVRGALLMGGMLSRMDPAKGLHIAPRPPPDQYVKESHQNAYIITSVVATSLMILATGARIAIRARSQKLKFGWDDRLIVLGCFFGVSVQVMNIPGTLLAGAGHHIYDLTYWNLKLYYLIGAPQVVCFYWTITVTKMSIVCFYMRLNGFASRKWNLFHWSLLAFLACYLISATLSLAVVCTPHPAAFWNPVVAGKLQEKPHCLDISKVLAGYNVVEILVDVTLMIVPVVMLWKVKMKWTSKLRVWLAGMLGLVNIVLAIGRTAAQFMNEGDGSDPDFTYTYWKLHGWSQSEQVIGVVTASLPVLSIVATRLIRKMVPRSARHGRYVFDENFKIKRAPARHPDDMTISYTNTTASTSTGVPQASGAIAHDQEGGQKSVESQVRELHVVEEGNSAGSSHAWNEKSDNTVNGNAV